MNVYLSCLFFQAISAAAPASFEVFGRYDAAKVSTQVTSQTILCPFDQGIRVIPSGLDPSSRDRPVGSKIDFITAETFTFLFPFFLSLRKYQSKETLMKVTINCIDYTGEEIMEDNKGKSRKKSTLVRVSKRISGDEMKASADVITGESGKWMEWSDENSSKLHPLLDIELVLQNVLSYLDTENLMSANLVCKTWWNIARKIIMKKLTLSLKEDTALQFLNDENENQELGSIKDDIKGNTVSLKLRMEHSECTENLCDKKGMEGNISYETALAVVQKLINLNVSIALNLELCSKSLPSAWRLICTAKEQLNELRIDSGCPCSNRRSTDLDIGQLLHPQEYTFHEPNLCFPNLKGLSGKYDDCEYTGPKAAAMFQEILLCSPAVESLNCRFFSLRRIFDVLEKKPNVLQHLKSLNCGCLNQNELKVLLECNLKLKSLKFSLFCGFRVPVMGQFLSSQGQSLESLSISFGGLPNSPEQFPCGIDLVKLKHLSITQFFGSIHFVSFMPDLETLTLKDMNLSVALHDEAAKYNYKSKLKSLEIFGGKGSTGRFLLPAVYHEIVAFFPVLTRLRMEYFTDSTLKIVVTGLPNLEELEIPNGIYSDFIIAGSTGVQNEADQTNEPGASFADLKKLKKVVLQSPKITDHSVSSGLMYCAELRSICIDSPMISDKSLKLLSNNPDLLHLELTNCYQLTPAAIKDAKQVWGKGRPLIIANQ